MNEFTAKTQRTQSFVVVFVKEFLGVLRASAVKMGFWSDTYSECRFLLR
jgi:hypothetical protein